MTTPYAMFFQLGQHSAKFDLPHQDFELCLRQAYLNGRISEDDEDAFWDGFYSLERKFFYLQ